MRKLSFYGKRARRFKDLRDRGFRKIMALRGGCKDSLKSTAVFLTQVAGEQPLPFELKVPNVETRAAMEEARAMTRVRFNNAGELLRELKEDAER